MSAHASAMETQIRQAARAYLEKDEVSFVIGYERGPSATVMVSIFAGVFLCSSARRAV